MLNEGRFAALEEGDAIANARGIPGTLGSLGVTLHDRRPVLLTAGHVLMGGGAEGDPVWRLGQTSDAASQAIGHFLYGRQRTIVFEDAEHYIDCAVASIRPAAQLPTAAGFSATPLSSRSPVAGDRVFKKGAATGITSGFVVSSSTAEQVKLGGAWRDAPNQILVRSLDDRKPFSSEGDSGALLLDEQGAAVGLLWGANNRGESLASHLRPILHLLGIELARESLSPPKSLG